MIRTSIFPVFLIFIVFISSTFNQCIYGQNEKSSSEIQNLEKSIDSLFVIKDYVSAIRVLRKEILQTPNQSYSRLSKLNNKLSLSYILKGDLSNAKKTAETALTYSNAKGKVHLSEKAEAFSLIGDIYYKKRDYRKAFTFLKKNLKTLLALKPRDSKKMARSYLDIAQSLIALGHWEEAESNLKEANLYLKTGTEKENILGFSDYYFHRGSIALRTSNYFESEDYFKKHVELASSAKHPKWKVIAAAYSNLGALNEATWDYDEAIEYLEKSIELNENEYGSDHITNAFNYGILSIIFDKRANYSKAIIYNKKTLNIYQSTYGEKHPRVGMNYARYAGMLENTGNLNSALKNYTKAIDILNDTAGENHMWTISTNSKLGNLYYQMSLLKKSLMHHEKAIKKIEEIQGSKSIITGQFYTNAAKTFSALSDAEHASDLLNKALKISLEFYGKKHKETFTVYNAIGNHHLKNKQFDLAISKFNLILDIYSAELKLVLKLKTNWTVDFNILNEVLIALDGKAKCLLSRYHKDKNSNDLEESLKFYKKADAVLEIMKRTTTEISNRILLASYNQSIPKGIVETQFLLSQGGKVGSYLNDAFKYSEKNKALTLQNLIYKSKINVDDGSLKIIRSKEKEINREKSETLSRIENEKQKLDIDSLLLRKYEDAIFTTNGRYDSLLTAIKTDYPKYYNVEYAPSFLPIQTIQKSMNLKTTLLEFFISDSTLFVFSISKKQFNVIKLPKKGLQEKIEVFNETIRDKDIKNFKTNSYELYKQLIHPIKDQLVGDEIIIIPDGILWRLNFDLLSTELNSSNNPKELSYLLNEYAISYSNSANYLFRTLPDNIKNNADCLAFSFSDSINISQNTSMSFATLRNEKKDLPGSRKEIKEISNLLDGLYLYGSEANESAFKTLAPDFGILHLALHGDLNHKNPENSKLYFTKTKDSIEDNTLYNHEIVNMQINSELTVLSACNSGSGKIIPGEGLMSIGNAFQYAGSKSLLMTKWEVSDSATPEMMRLFYAYLKDGLSKSKALQKAKLVYLKNASPYRSFPYYWGSFYLVGDTDPINIGNSDSNHYLILIIIIIFLVLLLYWLIRNKKLSSK